MNCILERGISRCFPEDVCLQRIVRREFLKSDHLKDEPLVDRMAIMAIKSIMHRKLMTDETDFYSNYIYKLIFKEPVGHLCVFMENKPIWNPATANKEPRKSQNSIWDEIYDTEPIWKAATSDQLPIEWKNNQKTQLRQLRLDGPFMFAVISQGIPQFYDGSIEITVTRYTVQISINERYVAEIPHTDGLEFDTFWAQKFTKMIMSKYISFVYLKMSGEGLSQDLNNIECMTDYIKTSILDKLPRVVPPEGYRHYGISRERQVYVKWTDQIDVENDYVVCFTAEYHYSPKYEGMYWGYLRED